MIIKSFETKKIDLKSNKILLLYGKNEGLKNEIKNNLLGDKKITSNYQEIEILDKTNEFFEGIYSKSLFEEERIIFINRVTDKLLKIISEIIEKKLEDLILILDSDNLEKKSKIRQYFEKSKDCVCIPFYSDTSETLSKLTFQTLKNRNIAISTSDINLIVSKCNGDRKILFSQLEKITNYSKSGNKIDTKTIIKLTSLIENYSMSELVDSCLAKNKNKTIKILIENNFGSGDCIEITRIFLNKLKKILKLCSEYEKNNNLDLTISTAKPPIFWKEKEITRKQILSWSPRKIREALYSINNIELLIKKNYENSINLITNFIFDLISQKSNN